jgi:hypothetical protein
VNRSEQLTKELEEKLRRLDKMEDQITSEDVEKRKLLAELETLMDSLKQGEGELARAERTVAEYKMNVTRAGDAERMRRLVRRFYLKLGPAKEWAENNYYQLPIEQQGADLITINAFWRDYAAWDGKAPFLSPHGRGSQPQFSRNNARAGGAGSAVRARQAHDENRERDIHTHCRQSRVRLSQTDRASAARSGRRRSADH